MFLKNCFVSYGNKSHLLLKATLASIRIPGYGVWGFDIGGGGGGGGGAGGGRRPASGINFSESVVELYPSLPPDTLY